MLDCPSSTRKRGRSAQHAFHRAIERDRSAGKWEGYRATQLLSFAASHYDSERVASDRNPLWSSPLIVGDVHSCRRRTNDRCLSDLAVAVPGRKFIVEVEGRELKFRSKADGPPTLLEPLAKDAFMNAGEERNLFLSRRDERGPVPSLAAR